MNLNEIKQAVATVNREVEFRPAGTPTGWFFELRHESAPEVQELMRRFQGKIRELTLKRKTNAQKQAIEAHENQLRVAHVAGWRWDQGADAEDGRPEFSNRELKALLNDDVIGYHLKEFIDEEVGSLDDFLARSEGN